MAPAKKAKAEEKVEDQKQDLPKTCFVIMPISDQDGYEKGHFTEVYQSIIIPACEQLGIKVHRADETKRTNLIHIEILKELLEADIAICDISSKNPNVMFELGLRQAFDKPVVLMKDEKTPSIFDISVLRYVDYDSRLKFLDAKNTQKELSKYLLDTYIERETSINSIVRLMSLEPAQKKDGVLGEKEVFDMMLNQFSRLDRKIDMIESSQTGKDFGGARTGGLTLFEQRLLEDYYFRCSNVERLCNLGLWDEAQVELEAVGENMSYYGPIMHLENGRFDHLKERIVKAAV